jgi:release factor glutamine methyltransferase
VSTTATTPPTDPTVPTVPTVDQLLTDARVRLAAASFAPPRREALLLLGWVLGWSEAQVLARGEVAVEPGTAARFRALLERRLGGEPMAYLKGEKEFYGRPFHVDGRVLIPRPETEHLVEAALAWPLPGAPRILDVGTGSGCLAVTLALELPTARVVATDLSLGALAVARSNGRRHGVEERIHWAVADLATAVDLSTFDLVVSNPPYIDPAGAAALSVEITAFEPSLALYAEDGGLAAVEALLDAARGLSPGAGLLLEIGAGQGAAVAAAARQRGLHLERMVEDYGGIPRTVVLKR